MIKHLNRALFVSAATLVVGISPGIASAEPPSDSPAKADGKVVKPTDPKTSADMKPADAKDSKAKSGDEKGDKKGDLTGGKADRESRKAKEHDAQKQKLQAILKSPMDETTKAELRLHAERVARIERIKSLATEAKDKDSEGRAAKLLDKENARHDKWLSVHASAAAGAAPITGSNANANAPNPANANAPNPATPGATPGAADTKGGAK